MGALDLYAGISGPASFGTGGSTAATATTGSPFFLLSNATVVGLPEDYVGEALQSAVTFLGASFASIGIVPGDYVYSLPNDTVTLRFDEPAVIPLPATLPLILGALGLTLAVARRRG